MGLGLDQEDADTTPIPSDMACKGTGFRPVPSMSRGE
jgi:hypothetical protein